MSAPMMKIEIKSAPEVGFTASLEDWLVYVNDKPVGDVKSLENAVIYAEGLKKLYLGELDVGHVLDKLANGETYCEFVPMSERLWETGRNET